MSTELEALTVRLAKENPDWGYDKIQGELLKLGYNLSASSVRNILKRHQVTPASERSSGSWRSFLRHSKDQILACDFFSVKTIWLKTICGLFFIELGSRRIHLSGCTTNPDTTWVTQQARQLVWNLKDDAQDMAFLIHDNDKKLTSSFDIVFRLRLMVLRDAAIVRLILFAGLRVGEIVQLRLNDVTLDERKGSVVVREGKGTKRREIPLNSRERKAMLEYLRVRPDIESSELFLGQRNEGIQSKTVQRQSNGLQVKPGRKMLHPMFYDILLLKR